MSRNGGCGCCGGNADRPTCWLDPAPFCCCCVSLSGSRLHQWVTSALRSATRSDEFISNVPCRCQGRRVDGTRRTNKRQDHQKKKCPNKSVNTKNPALGGVHGMSRVNWSTAIPTHKRAYSAQYPTAGEAGANRALAVKRIRSSGDRIWRMENARNVSCRFFLFSHGLRLPWSSVCSERSASPDAPTQSTQFSQELVTHWPCLRVRRAGTARGSGRVCPGSAQASAGGTSGPCPPGSTGADGMRTWRHKFIRSRTPPAWTGRRSHSLTH